MVFTSLWEYVTKAWIQLRSSWKHEYDKEIKLHSVYHDKVVQVKIQYINNMKINNTTANNTCGLNFNF
jgi:hypothetical protein